MESGEWKEERGKMGRPEGGQVVPFTKGIHMIRYRLDDLGWYQFEWLIQSLLKAECGLFVESWGGSGDYGRDAYSKEKLTFLKNRAQKGPFVFQVKFV